MGYRKILWRVTLPLARPGILAAVIYILTIGVATFDIPAILGLGNRVYMLSTFIYLKVHPQGAGKPRRRFQAEQGIHGDVPVPDSHRADDAVNPPGEEGGAQLRRLVARDDWLPDAYARPHPER